MMLVWNGVLKTEKNKSEVHKVVGYTGRQRPIVYKETLQEANFLCHAYLTNSQLNDTNATVGNKFLDQERAD